MKIAHRLHGLALGESDKKSKQKLIGLVFWGLFLSCAAGTAKAKAINESDLLKQVQQISNNLDVIRVELGKPKPQPSIITVTNATSRDVYFEAHALLTKVNALASEIIGRRINEPITAVDNPSFDDASILLKLAYKRISVILFHLGINGSNATVESTKQVNASDVTNAILEVNQLMNVLSYNQIQPADVFEQITLSIYSMGDLLQVLDISPRIPRPPKRALNKSPIDVYKALLGCFKIIETIAKESKVYTLTLHYSEDNLDNLSPSDVFDLSKLLYAEITDLKSLSGSRQEVMTYYPGYKTPSDVYQRVGILIQQLERLQDYTKKYPDWTRRKATE